MQNIPNQAILTQPINTIPTITQPVNTIPVITQPVNTIPVTTQPINTLPMVSQPINTIPTTYQPVLNTSLDPNLQGSVVQEEFLPDSAPIRSDFGKIKALEVLTFKEAELERTLQGATTFASVGTLQVLYFPNFDRFVLSVNDWKYPLLRRVPITALGNNLGGPVQYTLPSYNGFYTLRLAKVPHLEALQNLETIFASNSRFSFGENENILGRGLSPDDRFRGQVEPVGGDPYVASLGELPPDMQTSTTTAGPTALRRGDRIKRGFKKVGYKLTKGLSRKGKHNLNHLQARDIDSMKRTSEITIPTHLYPRREVERWITYGKEIAVRNGYQPEIGNDGFESGQLSPTYYETGRMRGYGSVDLGQGSVSAPFTSSALAMGITSERPLANRLYSSTSGTISGSQHVPVAYTKPSKMDKLKAKLPGTHHYHGEKTEGYTYGTHSVPTNPGVMGKLKAGIVGHQPYIHQGLEGPMGIAGAQSVYTQGITQYSHSQGIPQYSQGIPQYSQGIPQYSQGTPVYTGATIHTEATPVYANNSAPVYTHNSTPVYTNTAASLPVHTNPISSIPVSTGSVNPTLPPETHHTGFFGKLKDKFTHHKQPEITHTNLPTNVTSTIPTQIQQVQNVIPQTSTLPMQGMTQTQGIINNTATRIQNNVTSHIPTQHVDVMRAQEYLAHDQA